MDPKQDAWGEVVIRRDRDGLVVIEPSSSIDTPTAQAASVRASGGVLVVDVTRASDIPRALIDNPWLAQAWLEGVYGADVADQVALFEDPNQATTHTAQATQAELSALVGRIAVGYWLHRWWPAGSPDVPNIDARVLELEIGSLAWLAEALFVDIEPIERLLTPHAELLVDLVEELRSAPGAVAERNLGILTSALRATTDILLDSTPGYADSARLLDRIDAENAEAAEVLATLDWATATSDLVDLAASALLNLPTAQHESVIIARGAATTPPTKPRSQGMSTADWQQVPPRTVLARSNNVKWAIREENGITWLTVRVDAAPLATSDTTLMVRAYFGNDARQFPEIFALTFDPDHRVFAGRRTLTTVPDVNPRIDVFDPAYALQPRLTDESTRAALADRHRITEIIVDRANDADSVGPFIAERAAWEGWT